MTAADIDPAAVKQGQRASWDALSSNWAAAQDRFELGAAAVTRLLLDLGGVRAGHAVLDVGTGHGEPALTAARRVGPTGRVTGVDISPAMLDLARRRPRARPTSGSPRRTWSPSTCPRARSTSCSAAGG